MLSVGVYVESHVEHPILNLGLLSNRVFAFANISFILCMMALFAPGFLLPFYFEQLRGFSTIQTGLMLTPLPLMLAIFAPLSGSLADRLGSRWLSPVGLATACLGLFLLSQLNAHSAPWDIMWRLAVTGIGQGLFMSPNTRTMMGAAPRTAQGEASGLLATGRVLGQSMSVALGGTVFAALGGATAGTLLSSPQAQSLPLTSIIGLQQTFVNSFQAALLVCERGRSQESKVGISRNISCSEGRNKANLNEQDYNSLASYFTTMPQYMFACNTANIVRWLSFYYRTH